MIIDSNLYNSDSESRAWLISKINRISPDGIVRVTLAQDTFDQHNDYIERDDDGNVIGKWANYYNDNVEPTPIEFGSDDDITPLPDDDSPSTVPEFTSSISCSGKSQFKVGGSAKTFTVTFKDMNGDEVEQPIDGWSFYIDDDLVPEELLTLTRISATKVKVKFLGDDSYIGKILTVKCTSGEVTSSMDVEIIAL